MASASSERSAAVHRARRWDVLVLGTALPGLVAACRLALTGLRVLVVEEEETSQAFQGLWEPFLFPGIEGKGILHTCMSDLRFPLIDRRRLEPVRTALQVVLPEARIDIGSPERTQAELAAWGIAPPHHTQDLLRALVDAGHAERESMRDAPLVRTRRFRAPGAAMRVGRSAGAYVRGLPAEYREADPALRTILEAVAAACANLATEAPSPEARARLLAAPLEGTGCFSGSGETLRGLFRQRLLNLHGEFRKLRRGFSVIDADRVPGIEPRDRQERWLGRCMIINTPLSLLNEALATEGRSAPPFFKTDAEAKRRTTLHWRLPVELLPGAMAHRVVCAPDARPGEGQLGEALFRLQLFPSSAGPDLVELLASTTGAGEGSEEELERMKRTVSDLIPFTEEQRVQVPVPTPTWDDPDALSDPPPGGGWPSEVQIRLSSRPSVYHLPRHAVGALGVEGELLLGWRAGETILPELG